jgi:hypothetical protein
MANDVPTNLTKSLAILGYGLSSSFPRKVPISRRTPLLVPSPIFTAPNDETLLWSGETDNDTVYSENFGKLAKKCANTLVKQQQKDKVIYRGRGRLTGEWSNLVRREVAPFASNSRLLNYLAKLSEQTGCKSSTGFQKPD